MYYGILKRLLEKLRDNFERLNIHALIPTGKTSMLIGDMDIVRLMIHVQ